MTRLVASLAFAVVLGASVQAQGQTKVIEGDKGFNRQVLSDAKVYDAVNATVLVEQGRNNTGYNVHKSSDSIVLGGQSIGRGINRNTPWRQVYDRGNGACVRFEDSPDMIVRHHYGEFCWDGIKPAGKSNRPIVEDSWLKHIRDDAIEHDHVNSMSDPTLVVRRTFFDRVHTFLSITPGKGNAIKRRVRVEFRDNLMSLGCGLDDSAPCENRDKRLQYRWARPQGSGQAFKVRGCGDDVDLLFAGNSVMMETGLNTSGSNLAVFQCINVQPGSTNNTFYWLGGCDFRGLEMETVRGACVPRQFKLDPKVWSDVSNDRSKWNAEVAEWKATVWEGKPTDEPPDDPLPEEPDGPVDGEGPIVDPALLERLQIASDALDQAVNAVVDELNAIIEELAEEG